MTLGAIKIIPKKKFYTNKNLQRLQLSSSKMVVSVSTSYFNDFGSTAESNASIGS